MEKGSFFSPGRWKRTAHKLWMHDEEREQRMRDAWCSWRRGRKPRSCAEEKDGAETNRPRSALAQWAD